MDIDKLDEIFAKAKKLNEVREAGLAKEYEANRAKHEAMRAREEELENIAALKRLKERVVSAERDRIYQVKKLRVMNDMNGIKTVKDKKISFRITEADLIELKRKAAYEAMPYQTLLTRLVKKYLKGRLEFKANEV
jgi:predicted DNA binding CopG/RHH family protein